jgi:predicted ester cyclase
VIEEVLVTGSHGVSRWRFVGTHTGEFHSRAPTGKKVSVGVIHIDRFQGDSWRTAARWTCMGCWRS